MISSRSIPSALGSSESQPPSSVALMKLDAIVDPHYETHPAYGGAFPSPGIRLRLKALARLLPWLGFAVVKQLLLGDRLPTLPELGDGLDGGLLRRLKALPRYVPVLLRMLARACHRKPVPLSGRPEVEALRRDGIVTARLEDDELAELRARMSAPLDRLRALRQHAAKTSFKGNQQFFTSREHGDLYRLVTGIVERHGLMEAARAYLGRDVQLTRLLLQLNDTRDEYLYQSFPDAGLSNALTNYMHIDRAYDCLKCVIYLSQVGPCNGPFAYVVGSNRVNFGAMGAVVRRAVDRAGFNASDRETRRLFMALPKVFRRKSEFGCDLLDGSENSRRLLNAEYRFTSADGDVAVFDNLGIHRGAMVQEGVRHAIFITIA